MSQAQAVMCPYTHLYYTFVGEQQCLLCITPDLAPQQQYSSQPGPLPGSEHREPRLSRAERPLLTKCFSAPRFTVRLSPTGSHES